MAVFFNFKGHMDAFPLHLETHDQICEETKLWDTTEEQKFYQYPQIIQAYQFYNISWMSLNEFGFIAQASMLNIMDKFS